MASRVITVTTPMKTIHTLGTMTTIKMDRFSNRYHVYIGAEWQRTCWSYHDALAVAESIKL